MASATYPADHAGAALRLFQQWLGQHYARSTKVAEYAPSGEGLSVGTITVGRQWPLAFALLDTLAADATVPFESARAAIESRLDAEGRSIALWVPPGAGIPAAEPGLSAIVMAVQGAHATDDGRLEVRSPVRLYLRRIDSSGSVISIAGGLAAHWAQFTNRVPGTFNLNATELFRLPASIDERNELTERIVLAAAQPEAEGTQVIRADDVWTANDLGDGGSCVFGSPRPDSDDSSAALRRNLRRLLRLAEPVAAGDAQTKALILLGAATYAAEEKLSWTIRGMDPTLYAGYDFVVTVTDGVVRPLLEPAVNTAPWDVPAE